MGFGTHDNIVDSLMVYDILPQTITLYDIQIDFYHSPVPNFDFQTVTNYCRYRAILNHR